MKKEKGGERKSEVKVEKELMKKMGLRKFVKIVEECKG